MLTNEQIKALRDGCEGVTSGPWVPWGSLVTRPDNDNTLAMCYPEIVADDDPAGTLAAHIARCDPQTIAELCDRVLASEARVSELQGALSLWIGSDTTVASAAQDDHKMLEARVKLLEDALLPLADACFEDFCSDVTESGDAPCTDEEPIAFDDCKVTFGMIRRARKALEAEK